MYSVRVLSPNCSLRYGENLTSRKKRRKLFSRILRDRGRGGGTRCVKMTSLCIKNVRPRSASCRPTRVTRINKACNKREGGELCAGDKKSCAVPRAKLTRQDEPVKFGEASEIYARVSASKVTRGLIARENSAFDKRKMARRAIISPSRNQAGGKMYRVKWCRDRGKSPRLSYINCLSFSRCLLSADTSEIPDDSMSLCYRREIIARSGKRRIFPCTLDGCVIPLLTISGFGCLSNYDNDRDCDRANISRAGETR